MQNTIPEHFYFHGEEINQFIHIQVPMLLIKDKVFSNISDSAKILYGLLLNRTGLSIRNGWMDENNRTYILYTIESLMEDLGIGSTKAKKLFAELININETGIGLIEKVRVLNKPSRVYVLNFVSVYEHLKALNETKEDEVQEDEVQENAEKTAENKVGRKCDRRWDANATDGGTQMRPTVGRKCDRRTDAFATTNYNYNINNYNRNINHSFTQDGSGVDTPQMMNERMSEYPSDNQFGYEDFEDGVLYPVSKLEDFFPYNDLRELLSYQHFKDECKRFNLTQLERKQRATEELKWLIDYNVLKTEQKLNINLVDAMLEYMTDVVALEETVCIKGVNHTADMLGNKFFQLDYPSICYTIESITESSCVTKITNIKNYYIKCLISAKSRLDTSIYSRVSYDMAHW